MPSSINGGVTDMSKSQPMSEQCDGEMEFSHNDGRYEVWRCSCGQCGDEDRMLREKYW